MRDTNLSVWMSALVLLFLALFVPRWGQAQTARQDPPALTLIKEKGIESTVNGFRCDFGTIDRLRSPKLERTFKIKNQSDHAVEIDHLQPSCGCTTVLLTSQGTTAPGMTLEPGQQATIKTSIDLAHLGSGSIQKYLFVMLKGSSMSALTLEFAMNLEAPVQFAPAMLDFGKVNSGTSKTLSLLATVDKRLLRSGRIVKLISSNPDIEIVPRVDAVEPKAGGDRYEVQAYNFIVSPGATLGILRGTISYMISGGSNKPSARTNTASEPEIGDILLTSTYLFVTGEVVGKIGATPGVVVFGVVNAGQNAIRKITITGESETVLKGLKVTTINNWLTAKLTEPLPTAKTNDKAQIPPLRILEVTVTPKAPTGSFETQILITTAEGQKLLIPVVATVSKQ